MKIDKKQICLLLFAIVPASKFLILPTVYAHFAKQDAWASALINFLLDLLLTGVLLIVIKRHGGTSLYELLSSKLGKPVADAVYILYAVFFLLKAAVPLLEQKTFIEVSLYETSPSIINFLPFFAVGFYLCLKGFKAMARTGEAVFWFTLIGLVMIFFLSVGTAEGYYLLPVLKNPLERTLSGSYNGILWYGEPIILLFLMGKIKRENGFNRSVILTLSAVAAVCLATFIIFTCIYGDIAVRQIYSLTKMTRYSIALSNVGRMDYIATLFFTASAVLSLSVPLIFATECLREVFHLKRGWILPLVINGIALVFTCVFYTKFKATVDFFEKFFTPVAIIFTYAVPALLLLIRRDKNAKVS